MEDYIIYNHKHDSNIISILHNKMSTLNGEIIQKFINENRQKLNVKNIKIINITQNIYEYYEQLFLYLLTVLLIKSFNSVEYSFMFKLFVYK